MTLKLVHMRVSVGTPKSLDPYVVMPRINPCYFLLYTGIAIAISVHQCMVSTRRSVFLIYDTLIVPSFSLNTSSTGKSFLDFGTATTQR